jgi:methionine-gamma-lyase
MNHYLGKALAAVEDTEYAQITSSGMAAIACAVMQICGAGDEIISSRTIYGGTYALFKNFLPKFNLNTKFVNILDLEAVKASISPKTKIIYCETISNPLLEIADLASLRLLADEYGLQLVVDNTFSPLMITPVHHGAHIVIHSLTKYINGSSDCVAGVICAPHDFIVSLRDVNSGAAMLLGPVMDSLRSASILKNVHTLHVRMRQHSKNGMYVAKKLQELGVKVFYPGLTSHPQYELFSGMLNPGYGYGGMITLDAGTEEKGNRLMVRMQEEMVGYHAVSLGFYKTLFSSPGHSTSSEIPLDEQESMGLSQALVRLSMGIDNDIERSFERIKSCMQEVGII